MVPPLACVAAVGQLPAVWPAQTPPQLSEIYHFKLCPSQFITDKLKSVLSCNTSIQDYCVIFFSVAALWRQKLCIMDDSPGSCCTVPKAVLYLRIFPSKSNSCVFNCALGIEEGFHALDDLNYWMNCTRTI